MPPADIPLYLTRRVTFSSGHRYWRQELDLVANRALYGPFASPYNHGHNYVLDVTISGERDARTGMVVNIKTLDDLLQERVVDRFHLRSINDEIPEFKERAPSLENILLTIRDWIAVDGKVILEGRTFELNRLRLEEYPGFQADLSAPDMTITITRSYEFAASHRLQADDLDPEENLRLFGKCNNEAGHGHNFVLDVTVSGEVDAKTGMAVDIGALDEAVHNEVVDRYDHKNLNVDLPEFKGRMTTSEVVTQSIFDRLNGRVPGRLVAVRLSETPRSFFEVRAG